jgi:hypothetical protein
VPLAFATFNDLVVIATDAATLQTAEDSASLAENDRFETAIAPLPDKNHGYFYFDVAESYPLLVDVLGGFNDEDVRPYLEGIQAISAAAAPMGEDHVQHGTLYVVTNSE